MPAPGVTFELPRWRRAAAHAEELQLLHAGVYADPPYRRPDDAAVLAARWKFCVTGIGACNGHADVHRRSFGQNRITDGRTEAAARRPAPGDEGAQQAGDTGVRLRRPP
ncbi:MAG: hypothetical protein ACRDOH_30145 [Streptosporangiaceae bacterium]